MADMSALQKLGLGMQAFGEGMQGRGSQFNQMLQERQKQEAIAQITGNPNLAPQQKWEALASMDPNIAAQYYQFQAQEPMRQQDMALKNLAIQEAQRQQAAQVLNPGAGMPGMPPGYRFNQEGAVEPIPNSPQAIKLDEKRQAGEQALGQKRETANVVVNKVDEALKVLDESGFKIGDTRLEPGGMYRKLTSIFAGSDAAQLEKAVKTIKSNVVRDALQQMKDASKTGASGFGQMNVEELKNLENSIANLDIDQDTDTLRANLEQVRDKFAKILGEVPPAKPKSIDPKLLEYMTPEQKALFQ